MLCHYHILLPDTGLRPVPYNYLFADFNSRAKTVSLLTLGRLCEFCFWPAFSILKSSDGKVQVRNLRQCGKGITACCLALIALSYNQRENNSALWLSAAE
jgi:hypothetical protein